MEIDSQPEGRNIPFLHKERSSDPEVSGRISTKRCAWIGVVLCFVLGFPGFAQAAEKWTVKGRIMVKHVLPELTEAFGENGAVAGITVKVSARSRLPLNKWGTWNSWGQVKTGADGGFQVSETHGNDRRQFKVQILFDSKKLRIKEGQETSIIKTDSHGFPLDVEFDLTDKDWHEIHNDKNGAAEAGRKAGVINLGDIYIGRTLVRKHADLWTLYNKVFDLLDGYGGDYSFKNKVVVKYPSKLGADSYANPFNHHVYIKDDQFTGSPRASNTVLVHELMHIWMYEHSTGEDGMAWQAAKHGTTHQARENTTFVPMQEAFAEWVSYKILKEITDGKVLNFSGTVAYKYPDIPLTRAYIGAALASSERTLANVDYTERGWHSLFNVLSFAYLARVDLNKPLAADDEKGFSHEEKAAFVALFPSTSCPEERLGYGLKDMLGVFLKHPNKGYASYMGKKDMNFASYLSRAGAILPGLDQDKIKKVKSYVNPKATKNPCPAQVAGTK